MEKPNLPLSPSEQQALDTAMGRLERLLDASGKCVRAWAAHPAPNCPMVQARKGGYREVYDMAELLIYSAEDNLNTILLMRKAGALPQFAPYVLLRSAGEAIVRCRYLLEPRVSEMERLARCLNERLDNLMIQRSATAAEEYKKRVAKLVKKARAHSIEPLPQRRHANEVDAFGGRRRKVGELFAEHLEIGSQTYRFLSGFTHSRPWAQLRLDRARPSDEPGVSFVSLELDVVLFTRVLKKLLELHDMNVGFWVLAAGFPLDAWKAMKNEPTS